MKKKVALVLGAAVALVAVSTAGYSWNYATHAYIAGQIGTFLPILKMNQVYGIMAPDIFNLDFSVMDDAVLRGYTHGIPPQGPGGLNEDFMAVWHNADGPFQKVAALGYLGHNDAWGADYVAHWQAIPPLPAFPPPYQNIPPGYIKALAIQLDQILDGYGVWANLASQGIVLTIPERILFDENIVEYAGDILVKRADPQIGQKMLEACLARTPSFWALLMRAFPHSYQPLLKAAENLFQQDMIQYSVLLQADEATIITGVSNQMAEFSIQYLAFKTGLPASAFESLRPLLFNLSFMAMNASVLICQGANYMVEVNATASYVAAQLQARNITSKLLR